MSLLSQFFPSGGTGARNANGDFSSAITSDLSTFPIDILVIGGGGGGGTVPSTKTPNVNCFGFSDPNSALGGGGGSGRAVQMNGVSVNTGEIYPIVIGAGGAGGQNGGSTCFGSSLIAGGGGGGGHPSRFGRANYEIDEASFTAGSAGGDNFFTSVPLRCITPSNPSYPYFVGKDNCAYCGDKSSRFTAYESNINQLKLREHVGSSQGRLVRISPAAVSPCSCCSSSKGSSSTPCWVTALTIQGTSYAPYSTPNPGCALPVYNELFYRSNNPLKREYKYGLGGGEAVGDNSVPFNYSNGCYNVRLGFGCRVLECSTSCFFTGAKQFYERSVYNGTLPVLQTCGPAYVENGPAGILKMNSCIAPKFMKQSCTNECLSCTNYEATASSAKWQFSPISDDALRTAMSLNYGYKLSDGGPSLFTYSEACSRCLGPYGSDFWATVPQMYEITNPSTCFLYSSPCTSTIPTCLDQVIRVTPSYHSYTPCIGPTVSCGIRAFTPCLISSVYAAPSATLTPRIINTLNVPKTPCLHSSTWASAENGLAGTGSGGGGGVNYQGSPAVNVFSWQFLSTYPIVAVTSPNPAFSNINSVMCGFCSANPACACPVVHYCRCITPSPDVVATGGNGGGGSVWIIYPIDYPAATVTGNTPVPSPATYRTYYWQGNGTIKFNP
jgi:hypothetical protein